MASGERRPTSGLSSIGRGVLGVLGPSARRGVVRRSLASRWGIWLVDAAGCLLVGLETVGPLGFRLAIVRWFNRKLLRDFRHAVDNPAQAQRRRLSEILTAQQGAGYLRSLGVGAPVGPDQWRGAAPVVGYEELRPWIEPLVQTGQPGAEGTVVAEPVSMFLKTSGTTGRPKLLPVTPSFEDENDRARRVWIERMIAEDERNAVGCHLAVISPMHEGATPGGIPYGSNTGRIFMKQPEIVRVFAPVPYPVFSLNDFELRHYLILRFAARKFDVGTLTTANPSTIVLLCRKLLAHIDEIADDIEAGVVCQGERRRALSAASFGPMVARDEAMAALEKEARPDKKRARQVREAARGGAEGLLHRLWPMLTTVNCWQGGHAPLYLDRLKPFLQTPEGPLPLRDPGFSASEGFFGIPLEAGSPEGVLHVLGPFMEFVPEGQEASSGTLLAHELEVGRRYRIVVTTSGGLWRYDMRDVLEVTGFHGATPMVRFCYKAGGTLSVTGEKITEGHAIAVATRLSQRFSLENAMASFEFSDPPRYVVAIETRQAGDGLDVEAAAQAWDEAMKEVNVEYAEKRGSGRIAAPRVRRAPDGAFARWRQRRVAQGAPDGQVKFPPLVRSLEALNEALFDEGGRS